VTGDARTILRPFEVSTRDDDLGIGALLPRVLVGHLDRVEAVVGRRHGQIAEVVTRALVVGEVFGSTFVILQVFGLHLEIVGVFGRTFEIEVNVSGGDGGSPGVDGTVTPET